MPLFIMSMNWTEQGIRTIRDWPKRIADTRAYAKKVGVEINDVYLTSGDNDLIAILAAPDADSVAKFALGIGAHGNVRTRTAHAWTESELAKLISETPAGP